MSGFALYADQAGAWAEDMPRSSKVDPNFGEGFFRGTGQIFMREAFAKPARAASMAGAVVPIAIDAITGGTTLQDKYFDFHKDKFDSAVKFWTPTPGEVGMAAEIVGGLGGVLGQIMLSPHLAVSNQFLSQAEDLITQPGVSSRQALGVGAAQALGLGVGIWAPPALGYNLATKAATGAGVNLAQGVITRGASAAILGDNPAAASFPAFGGQEMLLDTLLGAAFGAASHFMPRWNAEVEAKTDAMWQARAARQIRAELGDVTPFDLGAAAAGVNNRFATAISDWAKAATPSDVAALATLRVAKHLNVDSLPGRATSPAAVDVHVAAMREAIQSLLADRPVTARVTHDDGSPIAPQAAETPARDILAQARQELEQGQEGPYFQELAVIAADPADPRRAELIGNLHPEIAGMPERPADPAQAQIWDEIHQPAAERAPGQPSVTDDLVAAVRRWDPESPVFHVKQPSLFEPVPDPTAAPRLAAMREEAARIAREEGLPPPEPDAIDVFVTREVGAAGRPPEEAQAAGAMWKAAFESFGKAAGVDPTQLFYRYMDRVIGYGTDKTPDAATTLMQEATRPANQIERYRPAIKTSAANGYPIFDTDAVAMGNPNVMTSKAPQGTRVSWLIYDRRGGGKPIKVGYVIADIDPKTKKFHALQRIEIDQDVQRGGMGEATVAMMLAQNGDQPMKVVDISHAGKKGTKDDALPFWKKMGTMLDNYSSDPNVQMDGRITLADYLGARRGQRPAAGRGNDAAEAVPADAQGSRGGADGTGRPRGADTLFQSPTGRWYYSALSAAIDAAPPRAQNAGTWKQWLQSQINAGRIKETEVEWSGIRDFIDTQEGKISPDQLRAYMEQARERGFLQIGDERKMLIGLSKDADPSTFMHESANFFLEVMDDLSTTVPALKADMEVLFKEWGITRADWDQMDLNGKRPYHKMFAESFEVYLMTNKAPTPELRTVFQRFRDWLLDVYQAATATGRKVSQPMRDLFDRMLDAQRREQATAQAAEPTPGPPPPPQPGESRPPVAVDPFNFELNGEPQPPKPLTLEDQEMRELIRDVVEKEAGWYQIGGRNVTGQTGVANFSEWIPNGPWWTGRPDKKMNAQMYINAVAKALVGDKLKPMEQRAVQYLLDHLNERRVEDWRAAKVEWDKLSEDLVAEGIEPTQATIIDLDAVARATAIDEAAVERLALQYGDDDVGFMAEVRRIIDEQVGQAVQGGQEGGAAPAEGATVPGGAAAAAGDGQPPAQRVAGRAGEAGSPDPLAREADRVAMENPSMLIQFEQPDGQVVRMTAAQYLEQVRMEAELARQDMALLTTAAECMLGAMT